ncbi:hypothetical protein XELAEV_18004007mg, partial [Xenopus laevis]
MDKYLGQSATRPQRQIKQKPKDKKTTQDMDPMDSDAESTSQTTPSQIQVQDLTQILGPLLDQKLAGIKEKITEILQVMNQAQKITEAEQRISTLEDELDITQKTLYTQQREIAILAEKVDNLENRSRIVGIPESVKGADLEKFIKNQLPTSLKMEATQSTFP